MIKKIWNDAGALYKKHQNSFNLLLFMFGVFGVAFAFSEYNSKIESEKLNHKLLIESLILEMEGNLSFSNNFLQDQNYYPKDLNSAFLVVGGKLSTLILEEALRSNTITDRDLLFSLWKTYFVINQVNGMIEDVRSKSYIVPVAYQQQKVLESLQNFSGPQIVNANELLVKYYENLDKNSN